MNLYNKYLLPKLIDWTCKQKPNRLQRQKIVPLAHGNVLEIGVGSGLNLPFYDNEKVKHLIAIDPSLEVWKQNNNDPKILGLQFDFLRAYADNLPIENNAIDTVVTTYTMCSIKNLEQTFIELRRVLKPSGKLLFYEHGKAPDKNIQKWQNRINPLWRRLGGGCNLNRDIPDIINKNGFIIPDLHTMYIPGWKPASFNFWGTAYLK
ncbi:class I SAM-dependent methyltransferase [Zhouia amylolytica]|uniref:class I SAM-dependent methyltransferase n=1 Tax=Zhouia amylolytica TaxID=376730 RepID=UPI0020CE9CA2|nr:class I SAM-dependent methyltransferase [Zhouia amylolytica]MCQ0110120.1 class I SAM-dependent methyltransferase [Zhouia amylolytica]